MKQVLNALLALIFLLLACSDGDTAANKEETERAVSEAEATYNDIMMKRLAHELDMLRLHEAAMGKATSTTWSACESDSGIITAETTDDEISEISLSVDKIAREEGYDIRADQARILMMEKRDWLREQAENN